MTADAFAGRALLIARFLIGLYLVELLLYLTAPATVPTQALATGTDGGQDWPGPFTLPPIFLWGGIAGIAGGLVLQVIVARGGLAHGRRAIALTWAALLALLGHFALPSLATISVFPGTALACVPSTLFVLWLLHHCSWFARTPLPLLAAAFGWGALFVYGFAVVCTFFMNTALTAHLGTGFITIFLGSGAGLDPKFLDGDRVAADFRTLDLSVVHTNIVAVLGIAAGVLVLILFRRQVTDVVTGLVLGAAAGLGYHFIESTQLINLFGAMGALIGSTSGFEYWIRQSIGLLGGPVTFGALAGAGLALATRVPGRGRRTVLAGTGLTAAIGGAAATEALSGWLFRLADGRLPEGGLLGTLIISPALWLLPQVPFMVVAGLLLRTGLRQRAAAGRQAAAAAAAHGDGVDAREVPFLTTPALRIWSLVGTWRRHGLAAAVALNRLRCAQADLVTWRSAQPPTGPVGEHERKEGDRLRTRVANSRALLAARTAAGHGPAADPLAGS